MTNNSIKFRNWKIEVDKALTEKTYLKIDSPSSESCGCNCCINFSHQRKNIYPKEILELFKQLGIDYKKETEISHFAKLENGLHYYSGWFHFKGNFSGKDCIVPLPSGNGHTSDLTKITDNFGIGFSYGSDLTEFDSIENLVQIEFDCKIPWVIDKELESE